MGNRIRYREFIKQILAERGAKCECCGVPARHPHHIIPVQETGINSEMVYESANVMIVCSDCHCLFHPNQRKYPWLMLRIGRSLALAR